MMRTLTTLLSDIRIIIVVRIFIVITIDVVIVGDGESNNIEDSSVLWLGTWLIIVALEPGNVSGEKLLKIGFWVHHDHTIARLCC